MRVHAIATNGHTHGTLPVVVVREEIQRFALAMYLRQRQRFLTACRHTPVSMIVLPAVPPSEYGWDARSLLAPNHRPIVALMHAKLHGLKIV